VEDTARFRQGAGRLCLDFIRTLRYRGRPGATEELTDVDALVAWAGECAPPLGEAWPDAVDVAEARRLREAIVELLAAARGPGGVAACDPRARRRVNRAAVLAPPAPMLEPDGQLRWYAPDSAAALLSLLARDALDLATSPSVDRLRECAQPDCAALFLDNSRPGSRRWCSMGACGNKAKKEALRHRLSTVDAG
jgi:predicted RNA-binding Zn ribbon-like protein